MVKSNPQLRQEALAHLKGRWGAAILIFFIYLMISVALYFIPVINFVSFLVTIPIGYGFSIWFLKFLRSKDGVSPSGRTLFDGFDDYIRVLLTLLISAVYTFLWTLLLIVPGVIKSLSYAMTPYILADYPELQNNSAIELSMEMMRGNKMKLFLMMLNFMLWVWLSCFTLGIALLWVTPYMQTTMAAFYEDVKRDYVSRLGEAQ